MYFSSLPLLYNCSRHWGECQIPQHGSCQWNEFWPSVDYRIMIRTRNKLKRVDSQQESIKTNLIGIFTILFTIRELDFSPEHVCLVEVFVTAISFALLSAIHVVTNW